MSLIRAKQQSASRRARASELWARSEQQGTSGEHPGLRSFGPKSTYICIRHALARARRSIIRHRGQISGMLKTLCPLSTFASRQIRGQPQQRPSCACTRTLQHNDSVGPRSCRIHIEAAPNAFKPASATHPIGPGASHQDRGPALAGWFVFRGASVQHDGSRIEELSTLLQLATSSSYKRRAPHPTHRLTNPVPHHPQTQTTQVL